MAVAQTANRLAVAAGNDVTLAFGFTFKIFASTDIKCWKISAAGVYTAGVLNGSGATGFTVSFDTAAETGTVTWVTAPVTGGYSVIKGSELTETQASTFSRDGVTPSGTTKLVADKLTVLVQQVRDTVEKRGILKSETLDLTDVEDILVNETPVTRRALVYERNDADDGWNIVPSDNDPDTAATAAAASATTAAAALTGIQAIVSGAAVLTQSSGLLSARPAAPATSQLYYSTDANRIDLYMLDAARWITLG